MSFKQGDTVQLASGSPTMTVSAVVDTRYDTLYRCTPSEFRVTCTWFAADGTVNEREFPGVALVKA
jgi:uncharacterized protein YodC (DUF2158 family)